MHFIAKLEGVFSNTPKGDIVIILGDFNTKIGENNNGVQTIMGRPVCAQAEATTESVLMSSALHKTFLLVVPVPS